MLKKLLNIISFPSYQAKGILILILLASFSSLLHLIIPFLYTNKSSIKNEKFLAFKEASITFDDNLDKLTKDNVEPVNYQKAKIYKNKLPIKDKGKYLSKKNRYDKKIISKIEINSASKDQLLSIPYIGPVFSDRIIKYRNMLGGFYSKEQFKEVYKITNEALDNLYKHTIIDTALIRKININASNNNKQIWTIPYLKYKQKKIIFAFIKNKGNINDLKELYNIYGVDKSLIDKIIPYLTLK